MVYVNHFNVNGLCIFEWLFFAEITYFSLIYVNDYIMFVQENKLISAYKFFRHVPKIKATTMAETPELKRIAENTKIQSNVKYHADFEKSKGKCTQVL